MTEKNIYMDNYAREELIIQPVIRAKMAIPDLRVKTVRLKLLSDQ